MEPLLPPITFQPSGGGGVHPVRREAPGDGDARVGPGPLVPGLAAPPALLFVGWLMGWLVGWLVIGLVGWLVGLVRHAGEAGAGVCVSVVHDRTDLEAAQQHVPSSAVEEEPCPAYRFVVDLFGGLRG